ncbi:MAG: alkaline phosphatase, partial [bacterium]
MSFKWFVATLALTLGTSGAVQAAKNFNRISSFPTYLNMATGEDTKQESSAEIISASADGNFLVYTDSPLGVIGMIDIKDPRNPKALGNLKMQGEPTAVSVIGNTAFVAVNTSESYKNPSGRVHAIDLKSQKEINRCELGGQPDSTASAPDGSFISIAIENERDEDLGDGRIPQMPAGDLVLISVREGSLVCGSMKRVNMTGLASIGAEDPEPEFVDINDLGETVLTLQENNHIAVVDRDGKIISHFSAGATDLEKIDVLDERGALIFNGSQKNRLREPDGIQWLNNDLFAIANEGDMDGGSRGFTVFKKDGILVYESGAKFEHAV